MFQGLSLCVRCVWCGWLGLLRGLSPSLPSAVEMPEAGRTGSNSSAGPAQGPPTGWCRDGPSYGTDGSSCILLERSGHPCEVMTSLCTPGPQPQQWMGRRQCINTVQLMRSGGCWEGEREPSLRDEEHAASQGERTQSRKRTRSCMSWRKGLERTTQALGPAPRPGSSGSKSL